MFTERFNEIDNKTQEEKERTEQKRNFVNDFFKGMFPDAFELMKDHLYEDFMKNPTGNLITVRTFPHHYKDKIVLIGDAAHAVVPFYGQGFIFDFLFLFLFLILFFFYFIFFLF
jgi:2-polyprenyl-6-methoxyphenol hydroxylase-like FAD-dependent oxidoreductase